MKRTSFVLALAALVLSFGLAQGQTGLTLDNVEGNFHYGGSVPVGDTVKTNSPIKFNIRWTQNVGANVTGGTNGFRMYSTDGAVWSPMEHIPYFDGGIFEYVVLYFGNMSDPRDWDQLWNDNIFVNPFGITGSGADTVGLGGNSKQPASNGIPDGFDEIVYQLSTSVDNAQDGLHLCIDSSYYPPGGEWLWSTDTGVFGDVVPAWDGPHCFTIYNVPNLPPEITNCPVGPTFDHCDLATIDFDALDDEGDPYTFVLAAGPGSIDANTGMWSYQPTLADLGGIQITVNANDGQDGPGCVVDISFTNAAPSFTAGCGANVVKSIGDIATAQMTAAANDCDPSFFNIVNVSPASIGPVTVDGSGLVSFATDNAELPGVYTVTVEVTDGEASDECDITFELIEGAPIKVCIETTDQSDEAYQGQHFYLDVNLEKSPFELGGFNFLIAYDASALSFQSAVEGSAFYAGGCGWEYFTYRYGADGNCSGGCPSGLLRIVGIAETNNGTNTADCFLPSTFPAAFATLDFLVSNDRTFECQFVPVRFFWLECGDNSLSSKSGDTLFISSGVFDVVAPDVPIQNGDVGYPTYLGAQNEDCFVNLDKHPERGVDFCNGGIFIACADSIDARGDLNLNEIGYEIADAVLFSNYFVYGIGVFTKNVQGQIAASDVNADGIALSVADLVYLIRVVVGDALPYPKVAPVQAAYTVSANGTVNVEGTMGAAFIVADGNVTPNLHASNMEMVYNFDGENTRILVYSLEAGQSFAGDFITVNGDITSIEMATYEGAPVAADLVMPTAYALNQNYPNPFNPTTTISFDLPVASNYTLTVYNVTGQEVANFSGYEVGEVNVEWNASNQASGIYFYRLDANNFSETKKMVLLK
jgi:hypothetical protein